MTDILPPAGWPNVRQLETNEFASGGANGNMNEQAKSLAARSELLKQYAALPYESKTGGYALNERVQLANGDIVRSTIPNNVNNPNENMTGWKPTKDSNVITTIEAIADLIAIQNPKDGQVVFVKDVSENYVFSDEVWLPSSKTTTVYTEWFKEDGDIDDTESFQRAFDYLGLVGGGALLPYKDKEYIVRNTNVSSNTTIGAFKIKQRIESEPLSAWALIKHVFHMESVENIVFYKTSIDGRRGYQNMDNQGPQSGGCTAWYFGKNVKNVLMIQPTAHHMGTDAAEFHGYAGEGVWAENPENIHIVQPNFYANRRNNISFVSATRVKIDGGILATSGIEVEGDQSGRLPLPVSPGSPELWSSPAIDIEPEAFCSVVDIEVNNTVIDGSRSGWMIYTAVSANRRISDIKFNDVLIKNPISGRFIEVATDADIGSVYINNPKFTGVGDLWFTNGTITIKNPKRLDLNGQELVNAFTGELPLAISGIAKVRLIDTQIGNYGLNVRKYNEMPNQEFSSIQACPNSTISEIQADNAFLLARFDLFARKNIQSYTSESDSPFNHPNGNIMRAPILWNSEYGNEGMGQNKKIGFIGRYTTDIYNRKTTSSVLAGSTTIPLENIDFIGVGTRLAVGTTRKFIHTVTSISGSSIQVAPALSVDLTKEQTLLFVNRQDWYGVTKQDNIPDATGANTTQTLNLLLTALRKSNILGNW